MDDLTTQLAETQLKKTLVIDALNYLSTFVEIDWIREHNMNAPGLFQLAKERVQWDAGDVGRPSSARRPVR